MLWVVGRCSPSDAIESSTDDTGTKSYYDLTNEAGGASPLPGFGASFRENRFPNMQDEQVGVFTTICTKRSLRSPLPGLSLWM